MEDILDSMWMQDDIENPVDSASLVYLAMFPNEEGLAGDLDQMEPPIFPAVVLQKPR